MQTPSQPSRVQSVDQNENMSSKNNYSETDEDPLNEFFHALHRRKSDKVKELVQNGFDVNSFDNLRLWTGLHHSAFCGNSKEISLLVSLGSDINSQDLTGLTPLHLAAANGKTKCVQTLINLGANVDICDDNGRTPYDVAANDKIRNLCKINSSQNVDSPKPKLSNTYRRSDRFNKSNIYYNGLSPKSPNGGNISDKEPPEGGSTKESGFKKAFSNAKRIAKWQILSIAARILLCYLLELFADQLKRILQIIFITYSPLDFIWVVIIEPLKLFLQPLYPFFEPIISRLYMWGELLITPLFNMLYNFGLLLQPIFSALYWILYPFQKILLEPIFNILWGLYNIGFTILSPLFLFVWSLLDTLVRILATPLMVMARYIPTFLQQLYSKLYFPAFEPHLMKLKEKAIQSVQPMLNIQGFFSRVFGPFISGLKTILHWFVPLQLLHPIQKLSMAIFGERSDLPVNTEETALMVIFVALFTLYGSILFGGYGYKLVYAFLSLVDNPLNSKLDELTKWVNYDEDKDNWTFSYYLPDMFHHKVGALVTLVGIVVIFIVNSIRFIIYRCGSRISKLKNGKKKERKELSEEFDGSSEE